MEKDGTITANEHTTRDARSPEPILDVRKVVKRFGAVRALQGVDFTVYPGEVVALVGDNGAGKSTLVKTISGVLSPDSGQIHLQGRPVHVQSPVAARELGIETVYQDLALAPDLDAAANLFLGRELGLRGALGRLGFLNRGAMRRSSSETFAKLGVDIRDPTTPVATLSGGQRQGVAVCRAVKWASKVILMDEPTAALGVVQTEKVLDLIRAVRDEGVAVVFISHNLPEVLQVSDRIEVLRLGRRVARFTSSNASLEAVVGAMTGAIQQND